jgi:hypothetical protein
VKGNARYVLAFLLLTAAYFWDVIAKDLSLVIGDAFFYNYPAMLAVSEQYRNLTIPLWNPYIFSGFPLMGPMQTGALYPPNVILPLLFNPPTAYNIYAMLHYSLAGFFTFLYARLIGLSTLSSVTAGMVFGLLGYLPSRLIHMPIVATGSWLPLVVYCFERLRQRPCSRNVMYASLAIAMQVFAGHPQICVYTYIVLFIFIFVHLFYLEPGKKLRFSALALSAVLLGLIIASPQLLATLELSGMGARHSPSYGFFSEFSFPLHMLPALFFPFLYGGGYGGEFWGPDIGVRVMDGFVGVLPLVLALTAFWRGEKKTPHIRLWGIIAAAGLLLSFGDTLRPLHKIMHHVPIYNSFRSPSRHWLEITFALSMLSGFGMAYLTGEENSRQRRALICTLSSVIGISLLSFTVLKGSLTAKLMSLNPVRPDAAVDALSLASPAVYIPLITMSVCLVLLLLVKKPGWLGYALLLVIFLEALSYKSMYGYENPSNVENYQRGLFEFLARDRENRTAFATLKFPDSMLAMRYGISSIDGFDPLQINDYGDLLGMEMYGYSHRWPELIRNNLILSLLNAKYLVVDEMYGEIENIRGRVSHDSRGVRVYGPPISWELPEAEDYRPVYSKVYETPDVAVYENLNVLPRAYPVSRLRAFDSVPDFALNMYAFQMDPRVDAAVSRDDLEAIGRGSFSKGEASITDYRADEVAVKTRFTDTGFLVLADQYYPGWRAYIDGEQVLIYRTNAVLRGVVVPPGEHELVFRYLPVKIYAAMALSSFIVLAVIIILIRKRK